MPEDTINVRGLYLLSKNVSFSVKIKKEVLYEVRAFTMGNVKALDIPPHHFPIDWIIQNF